MGHSIQSKGFFITMLETYWKDSVVDSDKTTTDDRINISNPKQNKLKSRNINNVFAYKSNLC